MTHLDNGEDQPILSMARKDNFLYASSGGYCPLLCAWDLDNRDNYTKVGRDCCDFHSMLVLNDMRLCCGGLCGDIWLIDLKTNEVQVVDSPCLCTSVITCLLQLSSRHKYDILSCDNGGSMIVWDAVTGKESMTIMNGDRSEVLDPNDAFNDGYSCLAVELQDGRVCCGGYDQLRIWELKCPDGNLVKGFKGKVRSVTALFLSSSGVLWSGHFDGALRAWDTQLDYSTHTYRMHDMAITCIVRGGADTFISGSLDGTIRVWTASYFL